jgi:ABC-type transport system substrate-binding protein
MNQAGSFILQENFWYPGLRANSDPRDTANATAWMTSLLNSWNFFSPTAPQRAIMARNNQSFQAVDANTIVLHTGNGYLGQKPYAYLLATIAGPIASAVDPKVVQQNGGVKKNEANSWMASHTVGTGPHVLSGGFLDIQSAPSYTLAPDSNYWGRNASLAEPWNNMIQPAKSSIEVDFQNNPAIAVNDMKTGRVIGASFAYIGPSTIHSLQNVPCVAVVPLNDTLQVQPHLGETVHEPVTLAERVSADAQLRIRQPRRLGGGCDLTQGRSRTNWHQN